MVGATMSEKFLKRLEGQMAECQKAIMAIPTTDAGVAKIQSRYLTLAEVLETHRAIERASVLDD
jgi:hypothetical protein